MTSLVTDWNSTLTDAQRTAWDLYGASVGVVNPVGDTVYRSGQNWFVGNNVPVLQAIAKLGMAGVAQSNDAPVIFDRGTFTTPAFVISAAAGITAAYTAADAWANEDGAALLCYQGAPKNPGAKFFKGPWRLVGHVEGDSVSPPSGVLSISAANCATRGYNVAAGQNFCLAFSVVRADGRLSTRRVVGPVLST